jgi:hypothetical protein
MSILAPSLEPRGSVIFEHSDTVVDLNGVKVWVGTDPKTNKVYAIKTINKKKRLSTLRAKNDIRTECEILHKATSEWLVKLWWVVESDWDVHLVMVCPSRFLYDQGQNI